MGWDVQFDDVAFPGPKELVRTSELKDNLELHLAKANKRPLLVDGGKGPEAVLIGFDLYRALIERYEDAYLSALLLQRKERQRQSGTKGITLDEAMKHFGIDCEHDGEI